jgi:hypothetical protein
MLITESMKFSGSSSPSRIFFFKHGIGKWSSAIKLKMLQARDTKAVMSMTSALISISSSKKRRWVASIKSHTTIIQIIKTEERAPITSAL